MKTLPLLIAFLLSSLVLQAAPVAPEQLADGWDTAAPSAVGLDPTLLEEMRARIQDGTYQNIHSVLLVKDGRLVLEEYFPGKDSAGQDQVYTRDTLHTLQSATKSVNSLLLGIALDQHLLPSVETPVATFFPEHAALFAETGKGALQVRHLLSMTTGLTWAESKIPYTDPRNDAYLLNRSPAPIRYVFAKPMAMEPGKKFAYHSGASVVLGEIVHRASGLAVDEFAERHLFGPLGITTYYWPRLADGSVHTGGGLWLRPRDMAKIGYLCLNHGRWQDRQIVSEGWLRESTRQQAPYFGYGYQWWLHTFRARDHAIECSAAQGLGGQFILLLPEAHLVAVFTGWNLGPLTEQPFEMLQRYILPALAP